MTDDSDRSGDDACASSTPINIKPKPRIQVSPGDIPAAVRAAEAVLIATGRYFASGGAVVRIVQRDGQGIVVEQAHEQTIKLFLADEIDWEVKGRDGNPVRIDTPHNVVQGILHGQDRLLPVLEGIARQPYFAPDGRLIATPGYDRATGIYAAFDASEYPLEEPTPELAAQSLAYLQALTAECDFENETDAAAACCAMLTATIRPSLPVAPAFIFTATGPGSGKSYLADVVTQFAGPEDPLRVSFPEKHEEAGKLVVTVLREKPSAVVFDDMQSNWKSLGPLNRALSSSSTAERLLRRNSTVTVSTRVLFVATGNNVEPERDACRRVVSVRLAPRSETPALRSFKGDPLGRLRKYRAEAVMCAVNIVRAFLAADAPMANVRPIATYDDWSRLCRHSLIWLGLPDPAQSLIDQVAFDPDQDTLAEFLRVWRKVFGSQSVTVRKLLSKASQHDELMEVLEDLPIMEGRTVNRGRLGWWIAKRRGRWADGLRLDYGDSTERNSWKVLTQ